MSRKHLLILATGLIVASIASAGWYYFYASRESAPGGLLDDVNLADLERNTATAMRDYVPRPDSIHDLDADIAWMLRMHLCVRAVSRK
jgi:hypothetical protein